MELVINCSCGNGGFLGAGIDLEEQDLEDIFFGLQESYYENYRDFEDVVEQAAKESLKIINAQGEGNEENSLSVKYVALEKALGEITVTFEVIDEEGEVIPGETVDVGIDSSDVEDWLFEMLLSEVDAKM